MPQRARYNSSLLDANITNPGDDYKDLYETYVIFITETDVLKANKPIYHADRIIAETGLPLNDGAHIIYVNGQNRDDTKLGRLMQDFHCRSADEMNSTVLAQRSRYFKEDEKGVRTMCRAVEELIIQDRMENNRQLAIALLRDKKMSHDDIVKYFNLPLEEVQKIAAELRL